MQADANRLQDRIFDPGFISDLESLDIEELRKRREMCEQHEAELSYARRLLQGKLDILAHELERRSHGDAALKPLIDELSSILSTDSSTALSQKRHAPVLLPSTIEKHRRKIERLASETVLSGIDALSNEEISEIVGRLSEAESKISDERRRVLDVLDRLCDEVVRRYREGEQDPAALLSS